MAKKIVFKRNESSRWGDVTYSTDPDDGWDFEYVHFPPEHPQSVCEEAVMKAGNLFECLDPHERHELIARCVELDHLPLERRIWELAVWCAAMAIADKWDQHLYTPGENDPPWTPAEGVERVELMTAAEHLADGWKTEAMQGVEDGDDKKRGRKKRRDDD